jgi:cytochrome P450
MSHLLRAQQQQPEVMTDKQIRDELMTFIFAGSDTTATTLAFAMYELSMRPELQQQVAEEVQRVLAACPEGACAAFTCAVACQ